MVPTTSISELLYINSRWGHWLQDILSHPHRCKFLRLTMPKWLSWTLTLIMDVDAHLNARALAMFVHITP